MTPRSGWNLGASTTGFSTAIACRFDGMEIDAEREESQKPEREQSREEVQDSSHLGNGVPHSDHNRATDNRMSDIQFDHVGN